MPHSTKKQRLERLDYYYNVVNKTILSKQNAASGLMPASVAITNHGDYTDAWVRDNVYSIYVVYGLALAYRRVDSSDGRAFELEHSVIKLMRGLLFAMMRQAPKVEKFKGTQNKMDALHAKYKTETGDTVVADGGWGHLQIDATSFFLVALADMTTSGLSIIFNQDEVDFVQNLVFYIERAYRTPDFGIWERGNKTNNGDPELNSSSIGMAVAALRAINGVNLFGLRGGPSSVIYVLPDELMRNATTLHSFLPRESRSKEIDGSVLSVIGFPAFAVDDPELVARTRQDAIRKLEGNYGWKRFLRDGHQTVLEDDSRLHYNESELKIFENIESEWPLFFTYMVLEGQFTENHEQVEEYRAKLKPVIIDSARWDPENPRAPGDESDNDDEEDGKSVRSFGTGWGGNDDNDSHHIPLLPELYYVPEELVEAEKAKPRSQKRIPNDNTPLVWALSLYLLGNLIHENLLSVSEIDPLGRRFTVSRQKRNTVVQVVLIAESEELKNTLSSYDIESQTLDQIQDNTTVLPPRVLADVYYNLGKNKKLGLTGRPKRTIGILGTSRLYRIGNQIYAFTPQFMDSEAFYLNSDPDYFVSSFESEIAYCSKHWFYAGRPTLTVVLTSDMIGNLSSNDHYARSKLPNSLPGDASKKNLLSFFTSLRSGDCNGIQVRLSRLSETINTSNTESLDFLVEKSDMDWESVLQVNKAFLYGSKKNRKLGYNESTTQASTPGVSRSGHRTPKRVGSGYGRALNTPLDRLNADDYFQDIEHALLSIKPNDFKLKDHEESAVSSGASSSDANKAHPASSAVGSTGDATDSPKVEKTNVAVCLETSSSVPGEMLSLTLGDRSQMKEAIESLKSSQNLYDQIDLLQYMKSCEGLDHYVDEFEATIKDLLEEVYLKAMRLRNWSIARQTAGVLGKIVPALTINITDLLIRQKEVSIGTHPDEFLISTPVGPRELKAQLEGLCSEDVREGPVVQEIIIYLGGFIRTMPHIFDGILRLRTHLIIIALREEISMTNNCDEDEAIEHLMQLSPFELQSLLGTILSGPKLCSSASNILIRDKAAGYMMLSQDFDPQQRRRASFVETDSTSKGEQNDTPAVDESHITIRAQAAGYKAGNFAQVEINGNTMSAQSRGFHVWAISRQQKMVLEYFAFDTHISKDESKDFARFLDWVDSGVVVVVASRDDITDNLTDEAIQALEKLGSKLIRHVKYRDSFVLIAEKGAAETAAECHKDAADGPTEVVERQFDFLNKDIKEITQDTISTFFPNSNGRWLRRRKNDGAFNRVPSGFFPQTWAVLDKCHGLQIREHCLPREPTVYEMTAEEFNFALKVENALGRLADPAERQIAVDTLMLIYEALDNKPDMDMVDGKIDLSAIMADAERLFWDKWVDKNKEAFQESDLFRDKGFDYDQHRPWACVLFYDLPNDDEDGESTRTYLEMSVKKHLPYLYDDA